MAFRILLVSDSYPPLIGGATRATQQIAYQLARRGHQVAVITAWQRDAPEVERDGDVEVYRLRDLTVRLPQLSANPYRHIPPPYADPTTVRQFRAVLRRFNPDVVHAYGWLAYACVAAMRGSDIPLVLAARDYGNICALRTLTRNERACDGPALGKCLVCASRHYGLPKGMIAVAGVLGGRATLRRRMVGLQSCSGYVQAVMSRDLLGGVPAPLDEVIPDFRDDTSDGEPDPAILARLPARPYILFVGALRRVKGIHTLLDAYTRLEAPPPLALIGTRAPDTPKDFPPNVTVLYDVPHATVMAAWNRALFGVAPSILPEPLGNVVHEAMSKGKPVIGVTPSGMSDMIIPGVSGLLVPAGDVGALALAMRRLAEDTTLREAMGRAAVGHAGRFVPEVVVPQLERMLGAAIQYGHRRPIAANNRMDRERQ